MGHREKAVLSCRDAACQFPDAANTSSADLASFSNKCPLSMAAAGRIAASLGNLDETVNTAEGHVGSMLSSDSRAMLYDMRMDTNHTEC